MFFQQRSHNTPFPASILIQRPFSILISQRMHTRGLGGWSFPLARRTFLASLALRAAPAPGGETEPSGLATPPGPPRGPTVGVVCERRGEAPGRSSRVTHATDAAEYAEREEDDVRSWSRLNLPTTSSSSSSLLSYASPLPE